MVARSRTGSTLSSTCTTSSDSKQRTTCRSASTPWMCDRNALPKPAPSLLPLIKPAMSVTDKYAGYTDGGAHSATSAS